MTAVHKNALDKALIIMFSISINSSMSSATIQLQKNVIHVYSPLQVVVEVVLKVYPL